MKLVVRILVGLLSCAAIIFGLRQMYRGIQEIAGASKPATSMELSNSISIPDHDCALRLPKDWEKRPAAQGGVMFIAPKSQGGAANLVINSDAFAGNVDAYAEENLTEVKKVAPSLEMRDAHPQPFAIDSGATTLRWRFRNNFQGVAAAQAMYFTEGAGGKKIVVTVTAPAAQDEEYGALFDACLRSLQVSPAKK